VRPYGAHLGAERGLLAREILAPRVEMVWQEQPDIRTRTVEMHVSVCGRRFWTSPSEGTPRALSPRLNHAATPICRNPCW